MNPDPAGSIWGQLLLILILTLINAFFAAAEIAVVSINPTKVKVQAEAGDKAAARLMKIMLNSTNFLATIQVGITFAGFLSSASAATTLADRVEPLFGTLSWGHEAAVILVTLILSYFSLVFGELYPKQIALQRTEIVAKAAVGPITAVGIILRPFVWLLSFSTNLLVKITPLKFDESQPKVTRDEMLSVIESSKQAGALEDDEYDMMEGIISLNKTVAREVMVPRTDTFMIDIEDPQIENIDKILNEHFSRIPVYRGDKDQIVGVIHIRGLLRAARKVGFDAVKLEDVMTEPLFVPETTLIDNLLLEMRRKQLQLAILSDEYGGVVGIVTIEDLIEEIVGEIDDETDEAETPFQKIDAEHYLVTGKTDLDDFNDYFQVNLQAPDVDTIAGYFITQLGEIPSPHHQQTLQACPELSLTSEHMDGARLVDVMVTLHPEAIESNSDEV